MKTSFPGKKLLVHGICSSLVRKARMLPFMLLILSSCTTLPEAGQEDIVGWLPPEADTVIRLIVPGNHYLLAMLLGAGMFESLEPVIDRLEMIAAGLDYDTGAVHVVVSGRWPKSIVASALNKTMENQPGSPASWIDESGGELILVSGRIMLYSTDRADVMFSRMEEGQKWVPLAESETRLLKADFIMWSDDSLFSRGGLIPPPPTAGGREALMESVVFFLELAGSERYNMGLNLRTKKINLVRPLTLMMRMVLMGLFGFSGDGENRKSYRQMKMDVLDREIQIFIPSISLEPLGDVIGLGVQDDYTQG